MDDPYFNLSPAFSLFRSMGMVVDDVGVRGMFAFTVQLGFPSKTVYVKAPSQPAPIFLSVQVTS